MIALLAPPVCQSAGLLTDRADQARLLQIAGGEKIGALNESATWEEHDFLPALTETPGHSEPFPRWGINE